MPRRRLSTGMLVATLALAACRGGGSFETPEVETILPREEVAMDLTSPAFEPQGPIPRVYTCDGQDVSPPLEVSGVPEGTLSLALVMDDPDAPGGTWDHWVVYDIAAGTTLIEEDARDLGTPGKNSWGHAEYGGPCPPSGTHRYIFRLYALDRRLDLEPGADKRELFRAMEGHVLAEAELMGTYERQR
jgi:Raf kinase inhibitor-like YbhB/YbcL family protein